jgi:hypothetical protein
VQTLWQELTSATPRSASAPIPISRLSRRGEGKAWRADSLGFGLYFGMVLLADLLATINMLLSKAFSQPNAVRVFWLQRQQPFQAKSKIVAHIPL